MEQPPVQIGQYVLGKNLGIGAFGKVRLIFVVDTSSRLGKNAIALIRLRLGMLSKHEICVWFNLFMISMISSAVDVHCILAATAGNSRVSSSRFLVQASP
jgi:hypothetical protein